MTVRVRSLSLAFAVVLYTGSLLAVAQSPPTPEQQAERAVKTRQGLFQVQAFSFGPVGAMMKGAPLDAALVKKEAVRLQMAAGMIPEVFQLDTHKLPIATKARESIWTHKPDFDKRANDLQNAAVALEAAAQKGDRSAIVDAAGKVGNACKACHDDFRDK